MNQGHRIIMNRLAGCFTAIPLTDGPAHAYNTEIERGSGHGYDSPALNTLNHLGATTRMSAEGMIVADGLTKQYGRFIAVRDMTFAIPAGQVVAFLGPNGAGKSTTMKLLTGFLAPTSGSARIAGVNVAEDRITAAERLGYLPENGPLYPDMTPLELLAFFGEARGLSGAYLKERTEAVVGLCALEQVANKSIGKLSKGYRQRVSMAQALLHDPDVLIMDEPTSGLDPNQIRGVRSLIRELGRKKTVLVSTHILQEVEPVADRVLFVHQGRLVFDGTPKELTHAGKSMEERFRELTQDVA